MACPYYVQNGCTCTGCPRFVQSTAIAVSGTVLQITIPKLVISNKDKLCVALCQSLPAGITNTMTVQLTDGTNKINVITPCGNNLYADQLRSRKVLHLVVATDVPQAKLITMNNLCSTSRTFPILNPPTTTSSSATAVAQAKEATK